MAFNGMVSLSRALPAVEHGVITFQYQAAKSVACATQEIQQATKVPKAIVKATIADAASSSSSTMANLTKEVVAEPKPKTKGISELQLSNKGINKPEPLLPQELAKVEEWQHARNQYLKAQREADILDLEQNLQSLVKDANQNIKENLNPDTMAAVIKENRGIKIYDEKTGELLDHKIKWVDGNNAVTNAIEALQYRMDKLARKGFADSAEWQICQENLSRLNKAKDLYTKLIEEAICHNKPQGPKL